MENKNMESVVAADVEFHEVLYRASRNERLADIVHNLRELKHCYRDCLAIYCDHKCYVKFHRRRCLY